MVTRTLGLGGQTLTVRLRSRSLYSGLRFATAVLNVIDIIENAFGGRTGLNCQNQRTTRLPGAKAMQVGSIG